MIRPPSVPAQLLLRRSFQRPSHSLPSRTPRRQQSTTSKETSKQGPQPTAFQSPTALLHNRVLTTLLAPLRAFGRTQQRRPYLTQGLSSLTIYALGDLSAQKLSSYSNDTPFLASYDAFKTLRAMMIGVAISIPAYHWFLFLGTSRFSITLPSSLLPLLTRWTASKGAANSTRILAAKEPPISATAQRIHSTANFVLSISNRVITNQLVFTPVFLTYFFTAHSLLTPLVCSTPSLAALPSTRDLREKLVETVPKGFVNSWKLWPAVTAVSFTVIQPQYRAIFAGAVAIGWQTYLSMLNVRAERAAEERGEEETEQKTMKEIEGPELVYGKVMRGDEDATKAAQREGRVVVAP